MRRFLIFPPLFSALFFAVQLSAEGMQNLVLWIEIHFAHTDFYLHYPTSLRRFLPALVCGCVVGGIFAALDFGLQPRDPAGRGALPILFRHLRREGLVGLLMALLAAAEPQLALFWWQSRSRYHAYAPEFQILNYLSILPPLILLLTLLLVMGLTLRRQSKW